MANLPLLTKALSNEELNKTLIKALALCRLWPQRTVAQPWQIVVEEMYAQASRLPLLWTPARGGLWLDANSVLFPDDSVLSNDALSSALVVLDVPLAGAEGRVLALMKQYMVGGSKHTHFPHCPGSFHAL